MTSAFSTSHRLMEYTLRAAVEYPRVRFLNCSIGLPHQSVRSYFGKMYEAKFLLGALAASMADNHRIGYHASVFASGALSEINAFAIGASLLDPPPLPKRFSIRTHGCSSDFFQAEDGIRD